VPLRHPGLLDQWVFASMTDITGELAAFLKQHDTTLRDHKKRASQGVEEFLKEANRIVCVHQFRMANSGSLPISFLYISISPLSGRRTSRLLFRLDILSSTAQVHPVLSNHENT